LKKILDAKSCRSQTDRKSFRNAAIKISIKFPFVWNSPSKLSHSLSPGFTKELAEALSLSFLIQFCSLREMGRESIKLKRTLAPQTTVPDLGAFFLFPFFFSQKF
jgi:hypothetical protein